MSPSGYPVCAGIDADCGGVCSWGYPVCAGIDRICATSSTCILGLPRMRGDRPGRVVDGHLDFLATPYARGSTQRKRARPATQCGYPVCAGIDLGQGADKPRLPGLPRMRGDRPHFVSGLFRAVRATPYARGSTRPCEEVSPMSYGYPVCAGIDLRHSARQIIHGGYPVCGDRPGHRRGNIAAGTATPYARGSTRHSRAEG